MTADNTRQPAIAFLPYEYKFSGKLKNVPLDALRWPFGRPKFLAGTTVNDLTQNDHLIVYARSWIYGLKAFGLSVNLSVRIVEPRSYHRKHMFLVSLFRRRFYGVITSDAILLDTLPNAIFLSGGDTWVPNWEQTPIEKTKMLSLISSSKKELEGHKLRHRIATWLLQNKIDADVIGKGYQPFDEKSEGLAPYRYSVVIENSRETGYLTEKLVDALLLKTVPIYWGAPDISNFFDPNGMIVCETEKQLKTAILEISEDDYNNRHEAMDRNRNTAMEFVDQELRSAKAIQASP